MNVNLIEGDPEVQYLGWALEHLPGGGRLSQLLAVPGAIEFTVAAAQVETLYRQYLYPRPEERVTDNLGYELRLRRADPAFPRYVDLIPDTFDALREPDRLFDADRTVSSVLEEPAYQAMLAGFLGGLAGDWGALQLLVVLAVRGPRNRQLAISTFLGTISDGIVGNREHLPPTKDQVVAWARQGIRELTLFDRLPALLPRYASIVRSRPDFR